MPGASATTRDGQSELGLLFALLAVYGIGLGDANAMPLLFGSIMDALSLDASQVGLVGTLELLAGAVGSVVLAPAGNAAAAASPAPDRLFARGAGARASRQRGRRPTGAQPATARPRTAAFPEERILVSIVR